MNVLMDFPVLNWDECKSINSMISWIQVVCVILVASTCIRQSWWRINVQKYKSWWNYGLWLEPKHCQGNYQNELMLLKRQMLSYLLGCARSPSGIPPGFVHCISHREREGAFVALLCDSLISRWPPLAIWNAHCMLLVFSWNIVYTSGVSHRLVRPANVIYLLL